jgi:predicted nucleic acid-binding protein
MVTTASNKVLVDTSAWIDFFRQNEPSHTIVQQLLNTGRVCSMGIIVAELMQGAKSEKGIAVLRDFTHVFEFLPEAHQDWIDAGYLSFKLRRRGKTFGLSDCFIAIVARKSGAVILTLDKHFKMMQQESGISVMPVPG